MGNDVDTVVIIGLGDVGEALYRIFSVGGFEVYGFDIDPRKTRHSLEDIPRRISFMHISIPFSNTESFVSTVKSYYAKLNPESILIHSTVAPGTTRVIHKELKIPVAYSPVRGIRKNLVKHLYFWTKWVSALPVDEGSRFIKHLEAAGLKAVDCECKPESLELAKLWETVYRALMIAAWQEIHRIAIKSGAELDVIARFIAEVHNVLGDRPIYYPDAIGGHCLIPNTRIMLETYRSKILEFILESNKARYTEINDEKVRSDIDRVAGIWRKMQKEWYFK